MPDVVERLKKDFRAADYRHIYDEGFLNSSIATQIKVLREERNWTQERLAMEARMNQSRISELEDVNFDSWTIRTLRKLARAFDVRLKISFEEFGTLLNDFRNLNRQSLSRRSFPDDPAFKPSRKPASADWTMLPTLSDSSEGTARQAPIDPAEHFRRAKIVPIRGEQGQMALGGLAQAAAGGGQ